MSLLTKKLGRMKKGLCRGRGRGTHSLVFSFLITCFLFALSCKHPPEPTIGVKTSTETQIDSLNNLAWELKRGSLQAFEQHGQQALKKSVVANYLFGKCEALQILGLYQYHIGRLDSALLYYQQALEHRKQYGDSLMIAGTLNNIANVYVKQGRLNQALTQYEHSDRFIPDANLKRKARIKDNIGAIYTKLGEYSEALQFNQMAELLFRQTNPNSSAHAKCRLNKANIYELMADYDAALILYREVAEEFLLYKDSLNFGKTKNNIGNVLLKQGQLDLAIQEYLAAEKIYQHHKYKAELAGVEQNIGIAYRLQGDYSQSLSFLDKSLAKWRDLKNAQKEAEVFINRGKLFLAQREYDKSRKAFLMAQTLQPLNPALLSELLRGLSSSFVALNQFTKAIPYQIELNKLRDSLDLKRIQWQNLEAQYIANQNRIDLLSKEQEISIEKHKRARTLQITLTIIILLLLLLFLIAYLNWQGKQKRLMAEKKAVEKQREVEQLLKNQELVSIRNVLEIQDQERKRIAQDLHDRLGSMLSMVKLHFQKTNRNIEKLKTSNREAYNMATKLLDEACNEVREIAHNLSSGVLKNIGLVAAIEDLKATLINTGEYEVEFVTHQLEERLPTEYEIAIFRIVQELVSNILRHAKANEISIQLLKKRDCLDIIIEDNGKGFDADQLPISNGIGIKNIKSRLLSFDGKLTIDSHPARGTSVFIELPIKPAA